MAGVCAEMRRRTPWRASGIALAALCLALSGCATGRSAQKTVTGWFGAGSADEAPTARRKPRRAGSEAAATAPEAAAPEDAASGAEAPTEAPEAGEAPDEDGSPEAPEKSIFDPY
jgi:hypothetical protein